VDSGKLGIIEKYLDAYTTALKNQPFSLMYIDAFADSGTIETDIELKEFTTGSVIRAVEVTDKRFGKLNFVESHAERSAELENIKARYPVGILSSRMLTQTNSCRICLWICRGGAACFFLTPSARRSSGLP